MGRGCLITQEKLAPTLDHSANQINVRSVAASEKHCSLEIQTPAPPIPPKSLLRQTTTIFPIAFTTFIYLIFLIEIALIDRSAPDTVQ
jgi:hypothetical protein